MAQVPTQAPVSPALRLEMAKLVIAGKKVLYAPQTRNLLKQGLTSGGDPSDILATQIAGVLKIVDDKSGMNVPKQVMVPAGLILLTDLVRFVEQTKVFKVTVPDVKKAIQKMILLLVKEYQIYDQQVARAHAARAQQAQSQPAPQPVQSASAPAQSAVPQGILAAAGGQQ